MQRDKAAADEEHASGKAVIEAVHLACLGFGNGGVNLLPQSVRQIWRCVRNGLQCRQQVWRGGDERGILSGADLANPVVRRLLGPLRRRHSDRKRPKAIQRDNFPRPRSVAHDITLQMSRPSAAMKQADMPSLSMSSSVGMVMTLPFPAV